MEQEQTTQQPMVERIELSEQRVKPVVLEKLRPAVLKKSAVRTGQRPEWPETGPDSGCRCT